jgi:predicted dehydrogenase
LIPKDSGGGYFHDMGCHALDILFYMFGDPLEITGKASNRGGLYTPNDTLSASLLLPDKLMATGSWSFVTPEIYQKDLVEVVGEKGKLEFSIFEFSPILITLGDHQESFAIVQPDHIQMPFIQSIVSEMNGIGKCPSTGLTAAVTSKAMDIISGRF